MRTLEELINKTDPAWPYVQEWIQASQNQVTVLPVTPSLATTALLQTQVTTHAPMGAIIFETGGLLIDHGWLRILGSGHPGMSRSLPAWNKDKSFQEYGETPGFLLIADDVLGGFFAINGGDLGTDLGHVYYLAPETLNWENLHVSYSDFLDWCFNGDMNEFYLHQRWDGWETAVAQMDGDHAFSFFPFLWTTAGKDISQISRKAVPIQELYNLVQDNRTLLYPPEEA
jgi:hypothetical protein